VRLNDAVDPSAVEPPSTDAAAFHRALPDYRPTRLRELPAIAAELGLATVAVKDESERLGLPAFKVLGASWAIERALREWPDVHTLVTASAGNHGRAVAHEAARRGLRARVYLPDRSVAARREAIAGEGAEVVVVEGSYEEALAAARVEAQEPGVLELADVGDSGPAHWVIDGYATLFAELEGEFDLLLVPVGVGSLAAAAARYGAQAGVPVVGVEPVNAACLTASLAAGHPVEVPTPGTSMAGLDAGEVSTAAWPTLRAGIHATITVSDAETHAAMRDLAAAGLEIGESGAAPLAALRQIAADLGPTTRVVLIATEGATDPVAYRAVVS
jgi:diaminopropionate ammonia-lyase